MNEMQKVEQDQKLYGIGIMVGGKRVDPSTVTIYKEPHMKCIDCKHWTVTKESANWLPEDVVGTCDNIACEIDIEVNTYGIVESIETNASFFCAAFEVRV